ncbi:MAG: DNA-directed polymerase subunit alpha [Synergistaceae bacterium]|nr:DNA-directed polymerase subunit alpha [Synergistaceae bacterium]
MGLEHIQPEIRVVDLAERYGKIVVEPLMRGYGTTLGNALRRVLLSSIEGAAIMAVRIEGVVHEFSVIPGVKEDMIELSLNLKRVPLKSHSAEVRQLRLEVEGPERITAAHIFPDSEVEFVDPDAYICTLAEGASLAMDLYVGRGVGYVTSDRPRPQYLPADALLIDAIFSPILRVSYEVQDARVGQRTDYDRLVLEVWTNGAVQPDNAIVEAAKILQGYFAKFSDRLSKTVEERTLQHEEDKVESKALAPSYGAELLSRPIKDIGLSTRSENCLLRGNIRTIGELLNCTKSDLLKIRNLGKMALKEIEEQLAKHGLALRDEGNVDNEKKGD